ncbi:MAG: hypothetical protein Q8P22_03760 [Chloroflexota bacterium]|nr:hypothetical protein [Chloroflexota bacterium]
MSDQPPAPLAGTLRVLYFLALLGVTLAVVLTGVFTNYERPQAPREEDEFTRQFEDEGAAQGDYERNVGLILALTGTGLMGAAILGLNSRFNPVRSGLLLAGLGLFGAGVGVGSTGSNDWITFVTSALGFVTVAGSFPWLEEGLVIGRMRGSA